MGAHFWLSFIGLFAYMISMMAGGSLKGLSWIEGNPFIESVILMKSYWVWRGIGGSLMFTSHLIFAYNFYTMVRTERSLPNREKTTKASPIPPPEVSLIDIHPKTLQDA